MNNEFRKTSNKDQTVYTLESASSGGTSSGSIASVSSPMGVVRKRGDNLIAQEAGNKVPPSTPRNFVAKNAKTGGAGAHKDKKKEQKQGTVKHKKPYMESFNGEYDDEAGMAHSNLLSTARAVMGLLKTIKDRDNLPEWGQEKIAKAEMMLVGVWDYLQSQKAMGNDPQQGVAEGSENNNPIANKIFFARSNKTPEGWSYDHVGFITQDGKQIQMSGHKGNDVYVTNDVTDDPEFPKQNIKIVSLSKPVSVPTTNSVGAENCGTFVANVLRANGIKDFDTQKLYSVFKKPQEQGVAEGVAETLPMSDAVKVLRHHGADHFKTTSNELHFYKNGRPFSVDLIFNNDATRSVSLSSLNSATRGLKGQGVAEGMDPDQRARLDHLIDTYRDATDPADDGYGVNDHYDPDEVLDQIRQEFGDNIANKVEAGTNKMHFPRQDHSQAYDRLSRKEPVNRITKGGKMYKQDSDFRKNTISSRYRLNNKSAVEGDSYMESLNVMLERQLEPTMDLDAWNDNFQNADPQKYHQFKNKTPEKKK